MNYIRGMFAFFPHFWESSFISLSVMFCISFLYYLTSIPFSYFFHTFSLLFKFLYSCYIFYWPWCEEGFNENIFVPKLSWYFEPVHFRPGFISQSASGFSVETSACTCCSWRASRGTSSPGSGESISTLATSVPTATESMQTWVTSSVNNLGRKWLNSPS